jgi:hypothetical protein
MALDSIMKQTRTPKAQIDFLLHRRYLEDCRRILDLNSVVTPGRVFITGLFRFAYSLLRMSELAEQVSSGSGLTLEEVDGKIGEIIEETKEAWVTMTASPLDHPVDARNRRGIQKVYANHLVEAMEYRFGGAQAGEGHGEGGGTGGGGRGGKYRQFKAEFAEPGFDTNQIPENLYCIQ